MGEASCRHTGIGATDTRRGWRLRELVRHRGRRAPSARGDRRRTDRHDLHARLAAVVASLAQAQVPTPATEPRSWPSWTRSAGWSASWSSSARRPGEAHGPRPAPPGTAVLRQGPPAVMSAAAADLPLLARALLALAVGAGAAAGCALGPGPAGIAGMAPLRRRGSLRSPRRWRSMPATGWSWSGAAGRASAGDRAAWRQPSWTFHRRRQAPGRRDRRWQS